MYLVVLAGNSPLDSRNRQLKPNANDCKAASWTRLYQWPTRISYLLQLDLFSKIFFASSVSCSRYMCQDESLSSGLGPSECCPPARLATKLTMRSHETIRMAGTIPHIFKPRCLGHTYTIICCDRGIGIRGQVQGWCCCCDRQSR